MIIVITIILYCNTFNASFHLDDYENIITNRYIHINTLSFQALKDAALKSYARNRPVANITFALNYYFGRLDPSGYHIVNIIIHIITAIILYFLIYNTLKISSEFRVQSSELKSIKEKPFWIALLTTLLWMSHPIQTQAITFIVQRMAIMATMFYLLSLLCYVKGRMVSGCRHKKDFSLSTVYCLPSTVYYLLSTIFALLAFGSKEISATLPIVIILYEIYFFTGLDIVKTKKKIWILGIIIIPFIIICYFFMGGDILKRLQHMTSYQIIDNQGFSMMERLFTETRVITHYITLLLLPLPSRLSVIKYFSVSHSIIDPITTLISTSIITGIIGYAIYISKRRQVISFFIIWFFINLVIESTIITLLIFYFEHRLYLPSIGFFVIIAIGIQQLEVKSGEWRVRKGRGKLSILSPYTCLLSTVCCILLIQSLWTIQRNAVWIDDITLWRDTVEKTPNSVVAHNHLGLSYYKEGMFDLAMKEYDDSLKINPNYPWTHASLGLVYYSKGNIDIAIEKYKDALKIWPEWDTAHNDMGNLYFEKGEIKLAIKEYKEALRINPDNTMSRNSLAKIMRLIQSKNKRTVME
ncbi:MAG: tetratricopeptide repeat protein [Nitrospirota bacterium]